MNVDMQRQEFFIGHTDKVSAIALNGNSSLLATIQAGPDGKKQSIEENDRSQIFL